MRRDRDLVHRILLAIEAKTSTRPHSIEIPGEDPQEVLDHLAMLFDEGLIQISGNRPHRSSSTGEVDRVLVRDLTPAGRNWLEAEAKQAGHPLFTATAYESNAAQGPSAVRLQGVGAKGMAAGEGSATARAILREDGSPVLREDGSLLLREGTDTAIEGHIGLPRRTIIIRTVLSNQVEAQLTAVALLSAIELKIEALRASGSNSETDEFHDLKRRVEEFLAANSKGDEAPIADATLSIADGLRRFWTEKHVSICEKTIDMALFGAGLAFCGVAGVLAVPTALTVGAILGGKNVVEAIKGGAKFLPQKSAPE